MTKGKVFASTLGVLAAAGAVVASVMMKKKGKVEVAGEVETKGNGPHPMRRGRRVRGRASVGGTSRSR